MVNRNFIVIIINFAFLISFPFMVLSRGVKQEMIRPHLPIDSLIMFKIYSRIAIFVSILFFLSIFILFSLWVPLCSIVCIDTLHLVNNCRVNWFAADKSFQNISLRFFFFLLSYPLFSIAIVCCYPSHSTESSLSFQFV